MNVNAELENARLEARRERRRRIDAEQALAITESFLQRARADAANNPYYFTVGVGAGLALGALAVVGFA